jgi:hypothetical protein
MTSAETKGACLISSFVGIKVLSAIAKFVYACSKFTLTWSTSLRGVVVYSLDFDEIPALHNLNEWLGGDSGSTEPSLDESSAGPLWRRKGCMPVLA